MKYAFILIMAYLVTACTITMSIKLAEKDSSTIGKEVKMETKK